MSPPAERALRVAGTAAVLALATVAAYGSFAGFEFVNWDDNVYVTANPRVKSGLSLESLSWALSAMAAHNWHPLTWVSHMLDVELFGLDAVGHHRTSLALHVLATLLLFRAFLRMTGELGRSALVAGLFALHPLHVESVAWIAERKDVLSGLCFAGVLNLYARYAERPSRLRYLWVFAATAAGLAAKPMLVTLPALLLLLDVWPLGRLRVARPIDLRRAGALVLEKLPLFALAGAASAMTVLAQGTAISLASHFTLGQRLGNALVSLARYLGATILPTGLSISYAHPGTWPATALLGAGLLLAGITLLALRALPTRPWLAVGWLWYVGMLVPVIGVIQVGEQAMADRYTYLPSIGLFAIAAWGIPELLPRFRFRSHALALGALAVLAAFGVQTRAQVQYWRNSNALWQRAHAVDPLDPLALEVLGVLAEEQNRHAEALDLYRRALEIDPRRQNSQYNLGNLLLWYGRSAEALGPLREAVRIRPDFAVAYEALGHAYRDLGEATLSLQAFQRSVELEPNAPNAQYNLGVGLLRAGRAREALTPFGEAARIRPDYTMAFVGLADAHMALGDRSAALADARRALALAREQGDTELAERIEGHFDELRSGSAR